MTAPILSLEAQLALTLASLCACRHTRESHDVKGCRVCDCGEYTRRTDNDQIAHDVLAQEDRHA